VTPAYLVVVVASWVALCVLSAPAARQAVLRANSTDVANLLDGRVYTLLTSAAVIEGPGCLLVVAAAGGVLAFAERAWGPVRLVRTFLAGHVGATLAVFAGLAAGVSGHVLSPAVTTATDVGVSYGLLTVLGALLVEPALPYARRWQALAVTMVVVAALVGHTFTDAGHVVALVLGLAAGHARLRRRLPRLPAAAPHPAR
jgi:hypothetical protein